jgi:hypothetical protein
MDNRRAIADSDYCRKRAEIFARIAALCSVPELVGYYDGLARNYLAQASGADPSDGPASPASADATTDAP